MKLRTLALGLMFSLALANCGTSGEGGAQQPGASNAQLPAFQNSQASTNAAAEDPASTPESGATPGTQGTPASAAQGETGVANVSGLAGAEAPAATEGNAAVTGSTGTTANAGGAAGSSAPTGSTFHVFLLLGQSNMAGYAKAQDTDKVKNDRIRVLGFDECADTGRHKDQWDVAVPPLHECWNGAVGPGDWFSKTLIDVLPAGDTIGLVPCAISGEKIETFLKVGGTQYDMIVRRGRAAQQAGGVIDGILFHQGESNSGDPSWPGKVSTLVTDLRTDLGLGNVPFLAGELAYDGNAKGHNVLVNQLPGLISNGFVVSAMGLALDPADTQWHLHFGHDETVTFGKRYAQKMIEVLGL
jgi:hypothetical protein